MASYQITEQLRMQFPGQSIVGNRGITAEKVDGIVPEIPNGSTDRQVNYTINLNFLKAFGMVANVDMTVKTNNATTPTDTFNLKAGRPIFWLENDPAILTANVSVLYVTNTSGTDGRLQLATAENPLP